jgi:hypothetical protein
MKCCTFVAVFVSLAIRLVAQTPAACMSEVVPIKPSNLFCSNAAPVCIIDQSGVNGRWVWGCPAASSAAPSGPDWVGLLPEPPQPESASDIARRIGEIRQRQQQSRQNIDPDRAGAVREWRQEQRETDQRFPLLTAYSTMPDPTGDAQSDERDWKKWLKQQKRTVRAILPPWSPEAYEKVRTMTFAEIR